MRDALEAELLTNLRQSLKMCLPLREPQSGGFLGSQWFILQMMPERSEIPVEEQVVKEHPAAGINVVNQIAQAPGELLALSGTGCGGDPQRGRAASWRASQPMTAEIQGAGWAEVLIASAGDLIDEVWRSSIHPHDRIHAEVHRLLRAIEG
jgi:hypothetical protein